MSGRPVAIAAAVIATNCEYLVAGALGVSGTFLSANWLVLPPVLVYLLATGQFPLRDFARRNISVLVFFALAIPSQAAYQASMGEAPAMAHLQGSGFGLAYTLLAFAIYWALLRDEKDLRQYVTALSISAVLNTLVLALVVAGSVTLTETVSMRIGFHRVARYGLGDPNITFAYVSAGACLWIGLTRGRLLSQKTRLLVSLVGLAGAALPIVYGLSRGAFLSFAAGVAIGLLLIAWAVRTASLVKYSLLGTGLLLIALACVDPDQIARFTHRWIEVRFEGTMETSAAGRFRAIKWLVDEIAGSPDLYGKGYLRFAMETGFVTYAHNSFVDSYIYGGVLGLAAVLFFIGKSIVRAVFNVRREGDPAFRGDYLTVLVHVCALMVLWMSLSLFTQKVAWAALAALAAANAMQRTRGESLATAKGSV